MAFFRRTLRLVATAWLACQVAWLIALVPADCCAGHRRTDARCHESASAVRCPMRGADGTPCPMHQGLIGRGSHEGAAAGHHDGPAATRHEQPVAAEGDEPAVPPTGCRLTGACASPTAALFSLLSNHGILPEPATVAPRVAVCSDTPGTDGRPAGQLHPPDLPPPRA
jgi:hypothetical protein